MAITKCSCYTIFSHYMQSCRHEGYWWPRPVSYQGIGNNYSDGARSAYGISARVLMPRQDGRHFADDTFNRIFFYGNVRISIEFSLKFVPKGPINNIPAFVHIMAWGRPGDKPSSEPMMVSLLTQICVTRPQWVKHFCKFLASKVHKWWSLIRKYENIKPFTIPMHTTSIECQQP